MGKQNYGQSGISASVFLLQKAMNNTNVMKYKEVCENQIPNKFGIF